MKFKKNGMLYDVKNPAHIAAFKKPDSGWVVVDEVDTDTDNDLDDMTIPQLRQYAADNSIAIANDVTLKDAIIQVIKENKKE